ncbi:hypothetical protein EJ08DRAFT_693029 [Tothia fuscella]|uniref:DUF7907 domain-containing protein n=1 Tax=Tothia fuscella TaxID=1048955 RepID=A0A9P4P1K5_9PEZI|nr:hypothetical protein EJ08DRAFT_693029 [Tothia fuscella]
MLFSTFTVAASCLATSVFAQFPPPPAGTKYYYFKTAIEAGQAAFKDKYDDLYLYSYHTGAGQGDAALSSGTPFSGHKGWFNTTGGNLNWFQPTANNSFYFGFGLNQPWDYYSSWQPAQINGGQSNTGDLKLDDNNKLVFSPPKSNFYGYIACDGQHLVPQLYWRTRVFPDSSLPANCAAVCLVAELAPDTPS